MKKVFMAMLLVMLGIAFIGLETAVACDCYHPPGTGSPGYWKNHPGAWPVGSITIGSTEYTKAQAIDIMDGPVRGNKWITMFKAYVAAFLNVENGNCEPRCWHPTGYIDLDEAYGWLVDYMGPPVRANSEAWQYSHGEAIYWCLDDYNNGLLDGIPSRDVFK